MSPWGEPAAADALAGRQAAEAASEAAGAPAPSRESTKVPKRFRNL
jgi:hypothetical protein